MPSEAAVPPAGAGPAHPWSSVRLASTLGIDESLINQSLALFFSHQDLQYMFVYREAFLADYFSFEHSGKYWSFPLLYALCALGAVRSPDPRVRGRADVLARCAQEIIVTHDLDRPTYTTVQALLCLAFYELGQSNSSKGWLLSGMLSFCMDSLAAGRLTCLLKECLSVWAKILGFTGTLNAGNSRTRRCLLRAISRFAGGFIGDATLRTSKRRLYMACTHAYR